MPFSETQQAVLAHYAECRRGNIAERFRPVCHFTPPDGCSNDPNGLCFWQGKWHLFYQFFPDMTAEQPSWGHAVSYDLIHWQDLPPAIEPGPETGSWSGATRVEADRVIAMYFGFGLGIMAAVASDENLLQWKKLNNDTVLPAALPIWCRAKGSEKIGDKNIPEGAINFIYDPCIWKKDDFYYALTGGAKRPYSNGKRHREAYLFRSKDLLEWEYMHEFLKDDHFCSPGDDCGCPYFLPLGNKHILIHFSHKGSSHYMIGDYDTENDKFNVLDSGRFGFGDTYHGGVFAPTACPDGKGGIIVMFSFASGHWQDNEERKQVMSLPRRLQLIDNQLHISPIENAVALRKQSHYLENITVPQNKELLLENFRSNVFELTLEIDWAAGNWQMFEVNILRSPDKEEVTSIRFHKESGYKLPDSVPDGGKNFCKAKIESILSIDTSYSSSLSATASRMTENAPVVIMEGENLKLRIFVDKSLVEVFANDLQCVSCRVYPGRADSNTISFSARSGSAKIVSCGFYELKSIW